MSVDQGRAQRWHDTDHGLDRAPPRRWFGRKAAPEPELKWAKSCWCCCPSCDPDYEEARPNPFWSRAQAEMGLR